MTGAAPDSPPDFPPDVVAAVCRHMDDDHADDGLLIVRRLGSEPDATSVRAVDVDSAGIVFLAQTPVGERRVRVPFAEPAPDRAGLRTAVVALHARAARA